MRKCKNRTRRAGNGIEAHRDHRMTELPAARVFWFFCFPLEARYGLYVCEWPQRTISLSSGTVKRKRYLTIDHPTACMTELPLRRSYTNRWAHTHTMTDGPKYYIRQRMGCDPPVTMVSDFRTVIVTRFTTPSSSRL